MEATSAGIVMIVITTTITDVIIDIINCQKNIDLKIE